MDTQTNIYPLANAVAADQVGADAQHLARDLDWLAEMLELRLTAWFAEPSHSPLLPECGPPPPDLRDARSSYAAFLKQHNVRAAERLIIVLAMAPHFRPQLLDVLLARNEATQKGFTEFGGVAAGNGFMPSIETALFLLAGGDLAERLRIARLLESGERLSQLAVFALSAGTAGETQGTGALRLSRRFLSLITRGQDDTPEFDEHFPARRVTTRMRWEELVLPEATLTQLDEIRNWLIHGDTLLRQWRMDRRLRPGFTSLFVGPSGTGKTLSACLLGKRCDCDVYRIDLSMVVSKYIGETEKNLARIFDQAEHRRWILFFDEADALFGKRTQVSDAHDRYANQEVSFLLQRIEEFSGVVILASNLKANIDDAFLRRFASVVNFPMPRATERLRLWREALPENVTLDPRLDLARVAERHELSGGTIVNVARYAALRTLARGTNEIRAEDIDEGVRRELLKEGRAA